MSIGKYMTVEDMVEFFGSDEKTWKALGVTHWAFRGWHRLGFVPVAVQVRANRISNDKLQISDKDRLSSIDRPIIFDDITHGACRVRDIFFTVEGFPVIRYNTPEGQKRSRDCKRLNIEGLVNLIGAIK